MLPEMRFLLPLLFSALLLFAPTTSATIMHYDLQWAGTAGFSGKGSFSFDTASVGGDNLITEVDLESFEFSFFDTTDSLLKSYDIAGAQSFDFETDTEMVRTGGAISTLFIGAIGINEFLLIGSNGCTTDTLILYNGDGGCSDPNFFLDVNGTISATQSVEVPEPALFMMFLAGLLGVRQNRLG